MGSRLNFLIVIFIVGVFVVRASVFTVDEREHALKFRFGEIVQSDYEPGIHFKIPFINDVMKYPDRILNYDQSEEKFLTGEKKNLIVDYFITWRIVDPGQYYRAAGGDEIFALERLSAIVKEGIKAQFSQRTVQEVVSAERSELMEGMLVQARESAPALGIEVVDVRVMRIDL
ncbi:uncharacterized protein METZ01_LOCUS124126, partial [marine metagenome]